MFQKIIIIIKKTFLFFLSLFPLPSFLLLSFIIIIIIIFIVIFDFYSSFLRDCVRVYFCAVFISRFYFLLFYYYPIYFNFYFYWSSPLIIIASFPSLHVLSSRLLCPDLLFSFTCILLCWCRSCPKTALTLCPSLRWGRWPQR